MTVLADHYDRDALPRCARGDLFGPGNAQLPLPPMRMMARSSRSARTAASTARTSAGVSTEVMGLRPEAL